MNAQHSTNCIYKAHLFFYLNNISPDEAKEEDDTNGLSGEVEGKEEDIPLSSEESGEDSHSVEGADFEQEEDDEEEDDKDVAKQKSKRPSDVKEGKTVFIRNLSFDSTEAALHELCAQFGPVDYSKIVMNQATDHSRGTGFVKFRTPEAAEKCIAEASAQDPSEGKERICVGLLWPGITDPMCQLLYTK